MIEKLQKERLVKKLQKDDFAFIEHFAVNSQYRNAGIGAAIINELVEMLGKIVCLEVEQPTTDMAKRRINFYKRNNFYLNEYPYIQPAISEGKQPIPMFIMTTGGMVDAAMYEHIKHTLYNMVYSH